MKILVINPPNTPFSSRSILIEPIDVLSTASYIASLGHDVKTLDMDVKQIHARDLALHVTPTDYDVAVIIYDYHIPLHGDETISAVRTIARTVKDAGCRIIAGGKTATYKPESLLDNNSAIDVLIRNEMEPALEALLEAPSWTPATLAKIPSLVFMQDGAAIKTPDSARKFNLDALPIPDRNLVDLDDYIDVRTLLSSRGCHMKCDFCHVPGFWGGWRGRTASSVADEIEQLVNNHDARKILFLDDNTTVNRKRMVDLCDELESRQVRTALGCLGSLSLFDLDMMERMHGAGFRWIHYGVESGDDGLLHKIHKKIDRKGIEDILAKTRRAGFRVRTSWIVDLPGSTREQICRTAEMILKTRTDEIRLHHLALRMGSKYYEEYGDVPSTQYIHNGKQNQNLSAADENFVKDTVDAVTEELAADGYAVVRNPDEFRDVDALRRRSPDLKVVSLCPLRYGLGWSV